MNFGIGLKKKLLENQAKKIDYLKRKEKLLSLNIETKTRDLYTSNLAIKEVNNQMTDIFTHMNDGFFFIDKKYTIGDYYSSATKELLNIYEPSGDNLIDILSKYVNKKKINSIIDYFELMFTKSVEEYTLMELNPLNVFEVPYQDSKGKLRRRFLNLSSNRVLTDGEINKIIIKIQDVTEQEELNEELKISEGNKKLIMDLMVDVISSDPILILEYINESEKNISELNILMKNNQNDSIEELLIKIGKIVHKMKGGALSLNLNLIIVDIHKFEDEIKQLFENDNVSGEDLLSLVFNIQKLLEYFREIRNLVEKLRRFNRTISTKGATHLTQTNKYGESKYLSDNNDNLKSIFRNMVSNYNSKYNESVSLKCNIESHIPEYIYENIKNILIHMINNTFSHAIDSKEEREFFGKPSSLIISIRIKKYEDHLLISYQDDGKGIDLDKVKITLKNKMNLSNEEIYNMDNKSLMGYLFKESFSTFENPTEIAGRGMGLPIIYSELKRINGKLKLNFKKNYFTKFNMKIELSENLIEA